MEEDLLPKFIETLEAVALNRKDGGIRLSFKWDGQVYTSLFKPKLCHTEIARSLTTPEPVYITVWKLPEQYTDPLYGNWFVTDLWTHPDERLNLPEPIVETFGSIISISGQTANIEVKPTNQVVSCDLNAFLLPSCGDFVIVRALFVSGENKFFVPLEVFWDANFCRDKMYTLFETHYCLPAPMRKVVSNLSSANNNTVPLRNVLSVIYEVQNQSYSVYISSLDIAYKVSHGCVYLYQTGSKATKTNVLNSGDWVQSWVFINTAGNVFHVLCVRDNSLKSEMEKYCTSFVPQMQQPLANALNASVEPLDSKSTPSNVKCSSTKLETVADDEGTFLVNGKQLRFAKSQFRMFGLPLDDVKLTSLLSKVTTLLSVSEIAQPSSSGIKLWNAVSCRKEDFIETDGEKIFFERSLDGTNVEWVWVGQKCATDGNLKTLSFFQIVKSWCKKRKIGEELVNKLYNKAQQLQMERLPLSVDSQGVEPNTASPSEAMESDSSDSDTDDEYSHLRPRIPLRRPYIKADTSENKSGQAEVTDTLPVSKVKNTPVKSGQSEDTKAEAVDFQPLKSVKNGFDNINSNQKLNNLLTKEESSMSSQKAEKNNTKRDVKDADKCSGVTLSSQFPVPAVNNDVDVKSVLELILSKQANKLSARLANSPSVQDSKSESNKNGPASDPLGCSKTPLMKRTITTTVKHLSTYLSNFLAENNVSMTTKNRKMLANRFAVSLHNTIVGYKDMHAVSSNSLEDSHVHAVNTNQQNGLCMDVNCQTVVTGEILSFNIYQKEERGEEKTVFPSCTPRGEVRSGNGGHVTQTQNNLSVAVDAINEASEVNVSSARNTRNVSVQTMTTVSTEGMREDLSTNTNELSNELRCNETTVISIRNLNDGELACMNSTCLGDVGKVPETNNLTGERCMSDCSLIPDLFFYIVIFFLTHIGALFLSAVVNIFTFA